MGLGRAFDLFSSFFLLSLFFWCDVTGSELFDQFGIQVQLFSYRGSGGGRAVTTHPDDSATVHLPQLQYAVQHSTFATTTTACSPTQYGKI